MGIARGHKWQKRYVGRSALPSPSPFPPKGPAPFVLPRISQKHAAKQPGSERLWLATFFLWHFYGYDDGGGRSGIQIEGTLEGQVGWGRSSANYLQEACVQFTAAAAQECDPLIDTTRVQFLYLEMSFSSRGLRERAQTAVAKNRGSVNYFFAPAVCARSRNP